MWSLMCCIVCLQALEYVRCDCGICVCGMYLGSTLGAL